MIRVVLAILLGSTLLLPIQLGVNAQTAKGPYVDEIRFIHYLDESVAVQEVNAGNLDLYFFRMPLELVAAQRNNPNVKIYESIGGSLSLLLNPAETEGAFNPFSIKEVRFAMNYLINRQLITDEILKGFGSPMFSAYSQFEPDYLVLIDTVESFGFTYNPQLAERMITEAMTEHGAVKQNGKWHFNGKPVELKFMIRSDDPRRNAVGELLSSELENMGFTVTKDSGDLNKAFTVVYGSDPKEFRWHLYTEGWGGRSTFIRYDTLISAQMYAPWFANMPGFQIADFWNYENDELDEKTQRIFAGEFSTKEERDQLMRDAVRMGIEESVRIFIASLVDPYIASSDMEGIVNDFSAGITSRYTLIEGREEGQDTLNVGVKQIYQGAWNPVGGFRDVYANRLWMGITDPGMFWHPHVGNVMPIRTTFDVETAGPEGKLDVPADAIEWDPYEEMWVDVGSGVEATSKVTYDLRYSKWHHGIEMNQNDILHGLYFAFEWGTDEGEGDPTVDSEYTSQQQPVIEAIKGVRFVSDDVVELYFDYWHFDEAEIAAYVSPWTDTPWEIEAAMESVVLDGSAAFSKADADARNVDWLSLIIASNADKVKNKLIEFRDGNVVPQALADSVSSAEAQARYDAAIEWIETKRHAVISHGPFYLENYNAEARTITVRAYRDSSYPFQVGAWKEFETAKVAEIANVNVPLSVSRGSQLTVSGEIESDADFSKVGVHYYVSGGGTLILSGEVKPNSEGKFEIELTECDTVMLPPGPNEFKIFVISDEALKPDIYATGVIVIPSDTDEELLAECDNVDMSMDIETDLIEQKDISIAAKATKKITLVAVKNNDDEPVNSVEIKATDGSIRFVKARGWDRDRIDQSTVMIETSERPIEPGGSLIVLLIMDNKQSPFDWKAFDDQGTTIASGSATVR